ncbi:ABC transporter ATP-binding protein [Variovorax robiniae]|uniref:ABC transporter ATP-binding protein n=1 Tax=Variovorax robiniae TaxID=1836199 RepID=A0ABU8XAZ1_9BURK
MTEPILQLHDLVKRYGGLTVTDRLNLVVMPRQVHAIIGPNGAGKTTLIQLIAGALKPNSGRIVFGGRDVTALAMHERVALGLARSYQITNVFKSCSVLDNLALSVQARKGTSMRFWRRAIDETALFREAAEIGERVGLADRLQVIAASLSHGEQRQLELGLALASAPQLLLLDEPMAGMGPEESARLIPLIKELGRQHTVVLIEHDMDAVFQLADCISVLVAGQVMSTGTPDQIRVDAAVKKAYLGDEVVA